MKIVKYLFLLLLLTTVTLFVYIATQKSNFYIQRSKVIKAPKTMLFNYVNDYKNWRKWNPLENEDSKIQYENPNQTTGLGASYSWTDKNGIGKIETVYAKENDSLAQTLNLNETTSKIYWQFKDTLEGTKVTWMLTREKEFLSKVLVFFGGNIQNKTGSIFEKGLNNLDTEIITELNHYEIKINGLVLHNNDYFLYKTASCNIPDLKHREKVMLDSIIAFFKNNNIPIIGAPFNIYKTYDIKNNTVVFSTAIPTTKQIITDTDNDYYSGKLPEFQALKTTLTGNYSHRKEAWDRIYKYLSNPLNEIEEVPGMTIEVFIKGPWNTEIPSEWTTEIYIPVKKKE